MKDSEIENIVRNAMLKKKEELTAGKLYKRKDKGGNFFDSLKNTIMHVGDTISQNAIKQAQAKGQIPNSGGVL